MSEYDANEALSQTAHDAKDKAYTTDAARHIPSDPWPKLPLWVAVGVLVVLYLVYLEL